MNDEFPLSHEEGRGVWACVLLLSTLGVCLGYSLLTHLFKT